MGSQIRTRGFDRGSTLGIGWVLELKIGDQCYGLGIESEDQDLNWALGFGTWVLGFGQDIGMGDQDWRLELRLENGIGY